jgi:hypothetical protein
MSRLFTRLFGAWLCLGLFAPAATACINDRESEKAEKEFKSRYIDQQKPDTTPTTTPENRLLTVSATAVGAVLLIGAVTITVLPRRRQ